MQKYLFVLLALFALNEITQAKRTLTTTSSATAVAVSNGGGSSHATAVSSGYGSGEPTDAKAVSVADGCNTNAKTTAVAEDGASVDAATTVKSDSCAPVSGETTAVGKGENTDISVSTDVDSDTPVDVKHIVVAYTDENGDVKTVATQIIKTLVTYKISRVWATLVTLADDEKSFPLFTECLSIWFEEKGCEEFQVFFHDCADKLIAYKLPVKVSKCMYRPCADFENATYCCGEAQLVNPYCSCYDGKCGWEAPKTRGSLVYWKCLDCEYDVPLCTCPY